MDVSESLSAIKESQEKLNAFIAVDEEGVAWKKAAKDGPLAAKTLAVKSNICVDGLLTSGASKTLEDYIAPYDATVTSLIKAAGGDIVGMANCDEFACGSSGETSFYGPAGNPAAPGRIPGGSSSGSAAAVAAGLVDLALGSDTGGSIRNPASHCGVVGMKPTYGLVSRYGLVDLAMSLDQIGPLARTVEDAALLLEVICGHDPRDQTSLSIEAKDTRFHQHLNPSLKDVKVGVAREFTTLIEDKGIGKVIDKAIDTLSSAGADIVDVELPSLDIALPTYYLNVYVEFFSATRKYDGRRYGHKIEDVCGEEVLRRILLGRYISQKEFTGKYYKKGLQARSVIRKELLAALDGVDVLAGPTVPKLPHELGTDITDPRVMYAYDIFTVPVNLAGVPAGVVPAGKVEGVPTGLQVIGKPLEDQRVLDVMAGFEQATT